MVDVDRFEGNCHLDWWANSVTCLASVAISLVVTAAGSEWTADGRMLSDDDREGFAFFCDLDPVFTLRFEDGSEIAVLVHPAPDGGFALTEYVGPAIRSVSYSMDL